MWICDSAGQYLAFHIAADGNVVLSALRIFDSGNILLDDRTLVETRMKNLPVSRSSNCELSTMLHDSPCGRTRDRQNILLHGLFSIAAGD